jgi:hypothetical protein
MKPLNNESEDFKAGVEYQRAVAVRQIEGLIRLSKGMGYNESYIAALERVLLAVTVGPTFSKVD